jgi:prepilin-type processing-associated H-X9-DG protein
VSLLPGEGQPIFYQRLRFGVGWRARFAPSSVLAPRLPWLGPCERLESLRCVREVGAGVGPKGCAVSTHIAVFYRARHEFLRGRKSPAGMTVLELLVVTAVVTLLVGLLLPAIQAARESARNVECQNHLRQIGVALHAHHDKSRGLPAGWHVNADGQTAFGWAPYLLPELEESGLSSLIDFREPTSSSPAILATTPALLLCPSDDAEPRFDLFEEIQSQPDFGQDSKQLLVTLPHANYVAVFGNSDPDHQTLGLGEGPFIKDRTMRLAEISRGVSKVMFIGERTARKLPSTWLGVYTNGEDPQSRMVGAAALGPNRPDADECEFDSRHPGHANFLWGDGRVQAVADEVEQSVYQDSARREE